MTTLVTGGSGFVGAHLVRALLRRGDRVRCLVRRLDPENLRDLDTEQVRGDLLDPESLRRAVTGCEVVYHCAADYRLYASDPGEIHRANVGGTRSVLEAARSAGVRRVVVTGSVGALATSRDDTVADEETPVALADMVGHYKRSKFLATRVALEAAEGGQDVVVVHPTTPIGELDVRPTPTGRIIVDLLNDRIPATVDTGLNFVDVVDVARGHLLAEERGPRGGQWILGGENLTLEAFLARVAEVAGRPPVTRRIPHALPLLVGAVDTGLARLLGRTPRVELESVRMARNKMYFDSSRAERELGYRASPLRAAIERAVADFRRRGLVPRRAET